MSYITNYRKLHSDSFHKFDMLKNVIAISFLAIYLLTGTVAHQLLKLPYIFKHFSTHRHENRNITFLQFLEIHYLYGSPNDKDYQDDMKLPFKTADGCITSVSPCLIPALPGFFIVRSVKIMINKNPISEDQFLLSSYLSRIWQPPKSC